MSTLVHQYSGLVCLICVDLATGAKIETKLVFDSKQSTGMAERDRTSNV